MAGLEFCVTCLIHKILQCTLEYRGNDSRLCNGRHMYRHSGTQHPHSHVDLKAKNEQYYQNLLSPLDALKHHFTSLKTDLIFLQLRVL